MSQYVGKIQLLFLPPAPFLLSFLKRKIRGKKVDSALFHLLLGYKLFYELLSLFVQRTFPKKNLEPVKNRRNIEQKSSHF